MYKYQKNSSILKDTINGNKFLRLIILISSLTLPTIHILNFTVNSSVDYLNSFDSLWIGFYSCIFLICFIDSGFLNDFKIVLVMFNVMVILFIIVFSLMGGLQGLVITIIKMILPFIRYDRIANFVFSILGYPPL